MIHKPLDSAIKFNLIYDRMNECAKLAISIFSITDIFNNDIENIFHLFLNITIKITSTVSILYNLKIINIFAFLKLIEITLNSEKNYIFWIMF